MERGSPEWIELKSKAEAEMSKWLAHPDQFGALPYKVEMVAEDETLWPYSGPNTPIQFVKYEMPDGQGGTGITGPVTKSFFTGVDWNKFDVDQLKTYYCGWHIASVSASEMADTAISDAEVEKRITDLITEMTGHKRLVKSQILDIEEFTFFEYRVISEEGVWISSVSGYDEEIKEFEVDDTSRNLPSLYLFIGERFYRGSALKWLSMPLEEQAQFNKELYTELFRRLLIQGEVPSASIEWLEEQGMSYRRAEIQYIIASNSVYEGIEKDQKGADQIAQLVDGGMNEEQARDLVAGAMEVINSGEAPAENLYPPAAEEVDLDEDEDSAEEQTENQDSEESTESDSDESEKIDTASGGNGAEDSKAEGGEKIDESESEPAAGKDDDEPGEKATGKDAGEPPIEVVSTDTNVIVKIVDEPEDEKIAEPSDTADDDLEEYDGDAPPEEPAEDVPEPTLEEPKRRGCAMGAVFLIGSILGMTWWGVTRVVN